MSESRPGEDVAARMEHDADELEHHLDQLGDQISDAQKAAQARREEAAPGGDDDASDDPPPASTGNGDPAQSAPAQGGD